MDCLNAELSLLEPDEKEQLEYIWNLIPTQDRHDLAKADVLLVLDLMDDFLEEKGLLIENEQTGEITYLEGEIDETEQQNYLLHAVLDSGRKLSSAQIQLILDAEMQYGIEQGYYEEE